MIIGYYEQSFFGGGTYIKLSRKENNDYKIESITSEVPNYIPDAEEYIKKYESIQKSEKFSNFFGTKTLLFGGNIIESVELQKFIGYIKTLDFKSLIEKKYYNQNILDGLSWEIFIELDEKTWYIQGYEDMPKEIEEIRKGLVNFVENTYSILGD